MTAEDDRQARRRRPPLDLIELGVAYLISLGYDSNTVVVREGNLIEERSC